MTINDLLIDGERKLKAKNIKSFHLDTQLLLSHLLSKSKSYILAHPDDEVNIKLQKKFNKLIKYRIINKNKIINNNLIKIKVLKMNKIM